MVCSSDDVVGKYELLLNVKKHKAITDAKLDGRIKVSPSPSLVHMIETIVKKSTALVGSELALWIVEYCKHNLQASVGSVCVVLSVGKIAERAHEHRQSDVVNS